MQSRSKVVHIVDDATAGGVMRVVDFLTKSGVLAEQADHMVHQIRRGRLSGIPTDADIIISHTVISWRTLPGLIALRAARSSTPIIHIEHSYTEGFVRHNVKNKLRFFSLLKVGFSLFDTVVAVSHAQAKWLADRNLCSDARLVTIPSCVNLDAFRAIQAPDGQVRVFGAIGRLDRQKGFDTLIEAFKKLPQRDVELHIYGEGAEEQTLKTMAEGDNRIQFKGFAQTPTDAFKGVDVVVMPSRWEALGLVALEALAARRDVLASKVDGLQDHADYGAMYFPSEAAEDVAGTMEALINRSNSERKPSNLLSKEADVIAKWRALIGIFLDGNDVTAQNVAMVVN